MTWKFLKQYTTAEYFLRNSAVLTLENKKEVWLDLTLLKWKGETDFFLSYVAVIFSTRTSQTTTKQFWVFLRQTWSELLYHNTFPPSSATFF